MANFTGYRIVPDIKILRDTSIQILHIPREDREVEV